MIFLETKTKNAPVSRENGNAHAAPYALKCVCVCVWGGGEYSTLYATE